MAAEALSVLSGWDRMTMDCEGPGRALNALHTLDHLHTKAATAGEQPEDEQWEIKCPRSDGCK